MKFVYGIVTGLCLLIAPAAFAQGDAAKGEKLYATKCPACHGADERAIPAIPKSDVWSTSLSITTAFSSRSWRSIISSYFGTSLIRCTCEVRCER
jgi:hypothetical protein